MPVPARAVSEKRVARHLIESGATSADRAIDYEPVLPARRRAAERLERYGIILRKGTKLYLDVEKWTARRSARRKRAMAVVGAGAIAAVVAALIG